MLQYPSEQQCNLAQQTGQLNKLTRPGNTRSGFVTSVGQSLGAPFVQAAVKRHLAKACSMLELYGGRKYRSKGEGTELCLLVHLV